MSSVSTIQQNNSYNLKRSLSHSNLLRFKESKTVLHNIFADVDKFVYDCLEFFKVKVPEDVRSRLPSSLEQHSYEEMLPYSVKVNQIQAIIDRNQMKCAFFGRTSNGKSTVINAMLGARILPAGIGHTTSCFVRVEGTTDDQGFLQLHPPDGSAGAQADHEPEMKPIQSVSELAHSLSTVKLATDSLICLSWPKSSCHLLHEDVVFLDSPGVNVDPDMDLWIDKYCLDADVFILVANAESTLMQAEKDFFHKVSSKISKPNIFILNNRWDASAGETEYVDKVREQHLTRCVSFLVDELRVCGYEEAKERVFFVSAREVLAVRSKSPKDSTPPGAAVFMGGYPLAEGWQNRLLEFCDFERVFEKIISDSATRTKFATHSDQGREIAAYFRSIMEAVFEASLEEKNAAIRYRQMSHTRLEDFRLRLTRASQMLDELITKCLLEVESQVANALCTEIRHLGELVNSFDRPFTSESASLELYKRELNSYVERELGSKLTQACSGDILSQVVKTKQMVAGTYAGLVLEEAAKNRILQSVISSTFEPEFYVDCRNLCSEFREDLTFRFSFGISSLAQKLLLPPRSTSFRDYYGGGYVSTAGEYSTLLPAMLQYFPSLISRNAVGALILAGIALKATGWRALLLCAGVYTGLYAYERLSWTNRAKEVTFKSQYVDYASHKLRLIVDLTGTNARHQVKRELKQAQKQFTLEGEMCISGLVDELNQLDADLITLDDIAVSAKSLKTRAIQVDSSLNKFNQEFINTSWN